jgi:hypothetical protein
VTHSREVAKVRGAAFASVGYDFGLPTHRPIRQWRDASELPVYHARWEQGGIRYTQTVFLTRLELANPETGMLRDIKEVLLVQLVGENFTSEYADAAAAFALEIGGRPVELELREGMVYQTDEGASELIAAVDVAAEGIASSSGTRLRFRGHMPPGTSGSMTVKILGAPLEREDWIIRLQDLEFDEALRRAKRPWKERPVGDAQSASTLRFDEPVE